MCKNPDLAKYVKKQNDDNTTEMMVCTTIIVLMCSGPTLVLAAPLVNTRDVVSPTIEPKNATIIIGYPPSNSFQVSGSFSWDGTRIPSSFSSQLTPVTSQN